MNHIPRCNRRGCMIGKSHIHLDDEDPMSISDAERAEPNHKFKPDRVNGLNEALAALDAAEIGTCMHEQIELMALSLEVSKLKSVVNELRHENLMLKSQGLMQSMVSVMNQPLVDLKRDIMAMQNVAPSQSFSDTAIDRAFDQIEAKTVNSPSIPKLALKLTFRIVLVIAVAVTVLAVVS